MDYDQFRKLVREMLDAQKAFFKAQRGSAEWNEKLALSKQYEGTVRDVIKKEDEKDKAQQTKLF